MCAAWKNTEAEPSYNSMAETSPADAAIQLSCFLLDDDPIDTRYLSWLLHQMGGFQLDIQSAHSLEDAKSICHDKGFDLYLLDYWMGEESSVSLLDQLSHERKGASTIVVLSSLDDQSFQELSLQSGADLFLAKQELSKKTLEAMLRNIVQVARKTQSVKDQRLLDAEKIGDWTKQLSGQLDRAHGFATLAMAALKANNVENVEQMLLQSLSQLAELRHEVSFLNQSMNALQKSDDINLKPFDVSALLAETVDDCQLEAEQCGKQLSFYEQVADSIILSDERLLKELVSILLRGSLRYAEEQSDVSVSYELGPEFLDIYISEFGASEEAEVSGYDLVNPNAVQFADLFESDRAGNLLLAETVLQRLRGSWSIGKSGDNLEISCRIPLNQDLLN
ncbi:response regulator [uncultured Cohaesibacter sp.]|uniref:ATP-binding response regulator n=1 Tax=uncultured Cohaesibacter sp. TaxID=1002546 RepID=UPI0029C6A386|nr:response regulator [uncultured Cohaesibacter sp.]